MSNSMLNKTIGRYELQEVIGEGAMATVYRAYDPEINRSVACKILKKEYCVDKEYTSRFLRESKAAGSLSHASIVTVHDIGEIEGSPYIMMELIEGKDLGEVLKVRHKLSVKETLGIAINLAKALDYAHSHNIVHRDIKPDNIILLNDQESIKVADFGIARLSESDEAQKTQLGSVLGTPRYMSPEQALGENIDGRSDLFSVGTIMYEMLTGRKAFDAENMGTLMMQIAQNQPPPLKKINADIPAGLRQIVNKLLQKSPEKRFQTGGEPATALIQELQVLVEQQEEQTKHKYIPLRYKWTLSAAAIVAVVLSVSMHIMFSMLSTAMTNQAVDSGESLAKFIATETAVPLLSEDWITLETLVNDASGRETFSYLIVTDRSGTIRAASNNELLGQPYQQAPTAESLAHTEDVLITNAEDTSGTQVFNIETPVLFQNTEVGKVILGVSQTGLEHVKSVSRWLMIVVSLVTISCVSLVMFIFASLMAKPLKAIRNAIKKLELGDFDARISQKRNDEMGSVFKAFNNMASSIQNRYTRVTDVLAQSGISIVDDNSATRAPTEQPDLSADKADSTSAETPVDDRTVLTGGHLDTPINEEDDATILINSQMLRRDKNTGQNATASEDQLATDNDNQDSVADNTKQTTEKS